MKYIRIARLCMMAVLALGAFVASSASAAKPWPLFVPLTGKAFPISYHGSVTSATTLETTNGEKVECKETRITGLILSVHLIDSDNEYLQCKGPLSSKCSNVSGASETILLQTEGHLGLADDAKETEVPAVLALVPSGFKFTCTVSGSLEVPITVKGSVIGKITSTLNKQESTAVFQFNQTNGKQEFTTFLSPLGKELNEGSELLSKFGEGTEEASGQQGESSILMLPAGETVEIHEGPSAHKQFPLYVPASGSFPVKYHGLITTATTLETLKGSKIECREIHIEGEILTVHLSDTHYLFLECGSELGSKCNSAGAPEGDILLLADEHLGLIDDPSGSLFNDVGVLILLPAGFDFTCSVHGIGSKVVNLTGSVIGQLVSTIGEQRHEAEFEYKRNSTETGMPLFTLFLSSLAGLENVKAQLLTEIGIGTGGVESALGIKGSILYLPAGETVAVALK